MTKFQMGDRVKKKSGSEWVGKIVGTYATDQNPEGYAVESCAHANSVQIYPATALEIAPAERKFDMQDQLVAISKAVADGDQVRAQHLLSTAIKYALIAQTVPRKGPDWKRRSQQGWAAAAMYRAENQELKARLQVQTEQQPIGEVIRTHASGSTVELMEHGMAELKVGMQVYAAPSAQGFRDGQAELVEAVRAALADFDECDPYNRDGRAAELMDDLRAALSAQEAP